MDKNDQLITRPFTYRITKDDKVIISRDHRQVVIAKGKAARRFIDLSKTADDLEIQHALARLTGHYKHGNES